MRLKSAGATEVINLEGSQPTREETFKGRDRAGKNFMACRDVDPSRVLGPRDYRSTNLRPCKRL